MGTSRVSRRSFLEVFVLVLCHLSLTASVSSLPGKICVSSDVDCSQLRQMTGGILTCVVTRDRVDCLKKLQSGEVDFGYFEAEDQKMAALSVLSDESSIKLEVPMEFSTGKEVRAVYLLVNNASNTKPESLCHPGFQRERFYPQALYTPTTLETKEPTGDIQSLIVSLSQSWKNACIPGPWSLDPTTDRQLKRNHPHLCNLCLSKDCDTKDPYAGAGALQCLLDYAADAAFVSDVDFKAARSKNAEVKNLYHFCRNQRDPIHAVGGKSKEEGEPCDWGQRPLPVLLSRACLDSECRTKQQVWLKALKSHESTLKGVLDLPRSTRVHVKESVVSPLEIIKQAGYKLEKSKVKDNVILCVQTKAEQEKCQDLAFALSAYNAHLSIGIKCLFNSNESNCFSDIYFGIADVITLDGGDVYLVTQDYGFERVLSEVYDEAASTPTSLYYAVAVVRAESNITSFGDLRGRKSCHTGIGKTAGWKIPVATLMDQRLLDPRHCNYVNAMAEFFSGGMCAPGGKSSKYNKEQNYIERLCQLCAGVGDDKCARSSAELFYSYAGAFRCLVHGGGDVAFVKHTTVPSLTGGSTSAEWSIGLQADQYKLLCPSGGTATAAISEYKTCNLALVPAHESVVSGRMSDDRKRMVRETLLGISEFFNSDAVGSKTFRLFGSYHGKTDLLFKDSAVKLRALSEDTPNEREQKKKYFKKLNKLHSCEVRVCALQEHMDDCHAMAQVMLAEGHKFVCISARDRMDCIYHVTRGQVDMTSVPGSYLGINPDLRLVADIRNPTNSQQEFRYKAVMVVRKSTVKKTSDLHGKKSCHTGYGRTTGWRIPIAFLKRDGLISPICSDYQSSLEHEIASVATTFNRACIPGKWAISPTLDAALKGKYKAMCSMCSSRTCDGNDDYAGYEGALRCLTQNGGDVAFSKLSVVKNFFMDTLNSSDLYGILCPDNRVVDLNSSEAEECYWAARPWDAYVTQGSASNLQVQRLFWALTQAKRKAEEDLASRHWYYTTLGFRDIVDILPIMEDVKTQQYYSKTRMDVVEAEEMCTEAPVRFCVISNEEENKCNALRSVLSLRGIFPPLQCVRGNSVDNCVFRITIQEADVISLNVIERYRIYKTYSYNLDNLITENYGAPEDTKYYLLAVVKKSPNLTSITDLPGKTTCHSIQTENATASGVTESTLKECLEGTSDFFDSFTDAITCLTRSSKDVAFVKLLYHEDVVGDMVPESLNPSNFQLLCSEGVKPLSQANTRECNLARVPANMVIIRQSETSARRQDIAHLLLQAGREFGEPDSFFRLFFQYFSKKDLLFKDTTTKLTTLLDEHYHTFLTAMWQQACQL